MKKTMLLAIGLVVALSLVLTACAQPTPVPPTSAPKPAEATKAPAQPTPVPPTAAPQAKAVHLVLWTKEGASQLDKVNELAKQFTEKNPNITIEVINYDVEKLRENFQTSMLAGQGPDLLWTVNDHAGPFTTAGLIMPVDDLGFDMKAFLPGALEAVKLNGKTWGIPLSAGNHLMLLYNKSMVKEPPKDTDELIKVAKELTKGDVVGLAYNMTEPFWLVPWLGGYGGQVFDKDGKPSLNTDAMKKTLKLLYDFTNTEKITPKECDYNCTDSLFKDGKAAMIINGDWSLGDYSKALGDKLGTAPIPKITGADWPKPYTSGIYFMFPKGLAGDKLEAAKKFVNFILSDEVQLGYVKSDKRLPAIAKLYSDKSLTDDPILKGSAEDLSHGTGMPPQAAMRCNWDAMKPQMQDVLAGKTTVDAAAAAMQSAAEKCVAELK
jgi:arabinogalactan oligomer/maltooligosaccharide transport system substrate-binding protein